MQWQLLFPAMIPCAGFVLVAALGSRRQAVLTTVVLALAECVGTSLQVGFLEPFSLVSLLLFTVLGGLSLHRESDSWIKLQPVFLGLCWAASMWFHDLRDPAAQPLLALILEKYVDFNAVIPPYQRGYFAGYAVSFSRSLPFLLVFHAGLTAWAAFRLSNLGWLGVRVLALYLLATALFYAERLVQAQP
jgi:intracellular septation protein A